MKNREPANAVARFLFALIVAAPSTALASDPTPIAGIVLIAGTAGLLISSALAAIHRFVAIGLFILWLYPAGYVAFLSFVYLEESRTAPFCVLYLAVLGLFIWVAQWRVRKDWSKTPSQPVDPP